MLYKTIRITPRTTNPEDGWVAYVVHDKVERVKHKTVPIAMGFYHVPDSVPDSEAFSKLKDVMIKIHTEEIKRMRYAIKRLKELELEKE